MLLELGQGPQDLQPWSNSFSVLDLVFRKLSLAATNNFLKDASGEFLLTVAKRDTREELMCPEQYETENEYSCLRSVILHEKKPKYLIVLINNRGLG